MCHLKTQDFIHHGSYRPSETKFKDFFQFFQGQIDSPVTRFFNSDIKCSLNQVCSLPFTTFEFPSNLTVWKHSCNKLIQTFRGCVGLMSSDKFLCPHNLGFQDTIFGCMRKHGQHLLPFSQFCNAGGFWDCHLFITWIDIYTCQG